MPDIPRQIATEARPLCFLCGRSGKTLHTNLTDFMFDAPGEWTLKQCEQSGCGLAWLDPFPLEKDLSLAYQRYYTHSDSGENTGRRKGPRELLYALYRAAVAVPGLLIGLGKEKTSLASMFLDGERPGRVLDVGCGDGGFLNRMRSRGWSVDGLDFDIQAIESAKAKYQMNLRHGDIKSPNFLSDSFDAITLNHVIEHVPNPLEVFAESFRILRPGGKLVMATPNILSSGHAEFKQYWRGLEPPRHLHIFSRNALVECARRVGLEVEISGTTAANADIIAGASYSILQNPNHRTEVEPPPNLPRTVNALLFQYREHLKKRQNPDCGEEVFLVCRKKVS